LAVAAGSAGLFVNDKYSPTEPNSLVSTADARVGRPATPRSAAGVARRTTRRTVGATAVGVGTVGVGTVGVGTRCARVVNANGVVVTRCR
jgi:hypothetical protein